MQNLRFLSDVTVLPTPEKWAKSGSNEVEFEWLPIPMRRKQHAEETK